MQITEQTELADGLLNDDESVLEGILRLSGPSVMAVMKRRYYGVLNEADLEDIMSIGLFRLWTARQRFDPLRGSVQVWFFRIVENVARDVLRLGWQKARQMEVFDEFGAMPSKCNGHSTHVDSPIPRSSAATRLEADLKEIIDALPKAQRHIITADAMARDDVASSEWLSEELGMPKSTVRVYRKRAMDRIRKELKQRGHDH